MEKVCLNGFWFPQKEVVFPMSNRAFRYGDSLFESFRIQNNSWIFFEDHFRRLTKGAAQLGFQLPLDFQNLLQSSLANNPSKTSNGFGRLMLFRNGSGKYTPTENTTSWLLEFTPSSEQGYPYQKTGLKIDLSEKVVLSPGGLGNYKTGNALSYVMASQEKLERGYDDLLLLGPARNIVESTNANIFLRRENQIRTPPLSQGCLAGIIRKKLISLVHNDQNYEL